MSIKICKCQLNINVRMSEIATTWAAKFASHIQHKKALARPGIAEVVIISI